MFSSLVLASAVGSVLIEGGTVLDGTGSAGYVADIRVLGERIVEIGDLSAVSGERVVDARGLVVCPGFIDAHSHADSGIEGDPFALSQLTQGITTSVVGQDGIWGGPLAEQWAGLMRFQPAINFAYFSGHGGLRARVLGDDYKRRATPFEIAQMKGLLEADMGAGSLGLSSGLEYDPGYYSNTYELAALAQVVSGHGGMYISHVRDESDKALDSFAELVKISREGGLRAQISHIKLGTKAVWGKAKEVYGTLDRPGITADVYPYLFWQSTASALTPSRDWEDRRIWVKALADVGGPGNVRVTAYSHDASWVGKDLGEISRMTGRDPVWVLQEMLRKTEGPGGSGRQSVAVTAMTDADLEAFIRHPKVMFCSDGSIGGSHPRGAGSFPRVLGLYVRERKLISLPEAVRKMTSLPAATFGLLDRGVLRPGAFADIVAFDAGSVRDRATAQDPRRLSVGIRWVLVNGSVTLAGGQKSGVRNGRILVRGR